MDKAAKTLKELCQLDYDAIEAYEEAIKRLDNNDIASTLTKFKGDHEAHIRHLNRLLSSRGEKSVDGPDMKRFLTEGKVIIADLMGDKAILAAMIANEKITEKSYKEARDVDELTMEERTQLTQHYEDEKRHKEWIESARESLKD
ncbi:DUF892 family protein [Alteromonas pelagimontana]|uniref:DUF892 family protein n=1 Tax=Alteromonas pelagimontana TaxID=1858656 RepID=A0A6M4MD12_9ALTE|nr:DUF2383 domain-containing protein [Alteromonas pelagimontana]QJR81013.1 DUF892 family protein [Alteromonas pelagimontana]